MWCAFLPESGPTLTSACVCSVAVVIRAQEELLQDLDSADRNRKQPLPNQQKRQATKRTQGASTTDHTATAIEHSLTSASVTSHLASHETEGLMTGEIVASADLVSFLAQLNLDSYIPALVRIGCGTIADLAALSTSDYERLGVPAGPQIKISKALFKHYTDAQNTYDTQPTAANSTTHHHPTRSTSITHSRSLDDSGGSCIVCWDGEITVLALPCRHLKFCRACMLQPDTQDMPLIDSCPVCRQHVERVMEVQTR